MDSRISLVFSSLLLVCFLIHVSVYSIEPIPTLSIKAPGNCTYEAWNDVTQHTFRNETKYRKWGLSKKWQLKQSVSPVGLTLISAFVYNDSISVTTTFIGYKRVGRKVICRYFDCNREEIPNTEFESIIFPFAVVNCARRAHAKYISLMLPDEQSSKSIQPIPMTFRAFAEPLHEFGVCLGQFYGDTAKWLEIVESVESHRILGATMFYFVSIEVTMYDSQVFTYYDRLGLSETVHILMDHKPNYQFHELQQNECYYRSRQHSKWVLNVDLDERLMFNKKYSFVNFLRTLPANTGEITFSVARVVKRENNMEKYENNQTQLEENLLFLKYNETSDRGWGVPKGVFNPNLVHSLFYHFARLRDPSAIVLNVLPNIGYIRHYRTVVANTVASNWLEGYKVHNEPLDHDFAEELKRRVFLEVANIYNKKEMKCEDAAVEKLENLKMDGDSCVWKNGTRINK
ncbi:unnamed protein product [Caenorhabditis angaria]|uniref:Glycosyltransferase family 92 protein n=1 Tax=Caenorhabditis angaria TaxID=860376 RepID=A0A9P1IV18_9PELO|nr:unnamed protein product [Caenorhabditis angaria]